MGRVFSASGLRGGGLGRCVAGKSPIAEAVLKTLFKNKRCLRLRRLRRKTAKQAEGEQGWAGLEVDHVKRLPFSQLLGRGELNYFRFRAFTRFVIGCDRKIIFHPSVKIR